MDRKKILIVDDTDFNRDLIIQLLEDKYECMEAGDGEEAIRRAGEERPDLILMDLGLPVLDGWEAAKRLKADRELKRIPIIAVTSHAMVGDELRAREVGCDDYLSKPIDENELMRKIRRFIG